MSANATEAIERKSRINILLVEDDPEDAERFKAQLAPVEQLTGKVDFEIEHLSSFEENFRSAAAKADIVVLDVYVNNSNTKSFSFAKNLINEKPHRAVIFLTAYPDDVRSRLDTTRVPFTLEKNERVMGTLRSLMVKIFVLQKSRFLLKCVQEMSQQHDQSYLEREYKGVASQLMDLNFGMGLMDGYINANQISEPHGYRRLHQALLPMFVPGSFGRSTFSRSDLVGIVEPNLSFAAGTLDVLKQIEGIIPNPELEREFDQLRQFEATVLEEAQYTKDGTVDGEIVAEEVSERPADVVRKYTDVKFPKTCVRLEKVSLKIQFKTEAPGHSVDVPMEGRDEVNVLVYISGDGFEIPENSKSVSVPRNSESEIVEFVVQPRQLGDQYLFLNFYKGTMRIGCVVVCTFVGKEENANE